MLKKIIQLGTHRSAPFIILFLLSFSVYLNTYGNQLTYDDRPLLLEDHRLRTISSLPALFTHDYFMVSGHNLYRPLPMLSIAVNYLLFGEALLSYRMVNQFLHGLNVILLYVFLGNFYKERTGLRFLASAIFAVHPAATEVVNILVYRAELFAFAFSLLAFHLYIRRHLSSKYLYGSILCYFLGMLSKESAMILPLFLLLYHVYFDRISKKAFLTGAAGYGIAALLVAGIRYSVLGAFGPQDVQQFFHGFTWSATAMTMTKAIAYYWKIVIWPTRLQMNYDFSDFPVVESLFDVEVLASLLFLTSLIALALWLFRRDRTLSYFVLWPFIALLPVMNIIIPTGVLIAVRLLYLPMVGYSVLLAYILFLPIGFVQKTSRVDRLRWHQVALFGYIGVVLLLLASLTLTRNTDFKDAKTLFRKDLLLSPNNVLSIKFLAPELPLEEAEPLLLRALTIHPSDAAVLSLLGEIYEKRGDHKTAESMQRRSLAIGRTYRAHKQLGIVLSNTGRFDEAEEHFRAVLELKPYWSGAYEDLAIVLLRQGERESALRLVRKALSLNPDSAKAYNLLGVYYKGEKNFEKAAAAFRRSADSYLRAETTAPGYFEALYNLADVIESFNPDMAMQAWTDYIRAAEAAPSEQAWVGEARARLTALSEGQHR